METSPVDPALPANGADPAIQAVDPRDYVARLRSDPDFAEAEIKKTRSELDKSRNELRALNPLKDIVSRLDGGAAAVAQLVYEQAAVLQHPEVRSVVEHYRRTGTLPTTVMSRQGAAPETEEYVDPVDQLRGELSALREQYQTLAGHVQQGRTQIAHTTTQSHLQKLSERYADIWDVISPSILEQAESWEKSPQGRDVLSGSTFETWDNIAKIAIGSHLDAVTARRAERRVEKLSGLGTEPRPHTVTTGREDPVQRVETWRPGTARKLIEDIRRREGRSA